MGFVVIGDIHGRDVWMNFVNKHKGSHFIFLGDYVDPYEDIDDYEALINLNIILNYKKSHPNNVTLLIGNHDIQYIDYPKYATSALHFNEKILETTKVFKANKKHFQFAYQKGDKLFVHGGVINSWFNKYKDLLEFFGLKEDNSNLGDVLNDVGGDSKWRSVLMDISYLRKGYHDFSGPLWADRYELFDDTLDGIKQYVGHNKMANIWTKRNKNGGSITFCDVLAVKEECLIL